jgi:hypothetical protein
MTEHAVMIVGGGTTGKMLAGELAGEPEWGQCRDALEIPSLSKIGAGVR